MRLTDGNPCRVANDTPAEFIMMQQTGLCISEMLREAQSLLSSHTYRRDQPIQQLWVVHGLAARCSENSGLPRRDCRTHWYPGGCMSVSSVGSSPALQWLQNYLSSSGAATGTQPPCGCQSSRDSSSISQEAVQLNASQVSQATDPSQASAAGGSQGHHHHHHHGGGHGGGSFVDQLAQSLVTDLQQAIGSGDASGPGSLTTTTGSAGSTATAGSFIDQLASQISKDLLARYQQASGSSASSSPTSVATQVNAIA
jgi:hypothetical protein